MPPTRQVLAALREYPSVVLHQPRPQKRTHLDRVVVSAPGYQWQADLADMQGQLHSNRLGHKHMRYILTVVDCFSRYAWAEAVERKDPTTVAAAFDLILERAKRERRGPPHKLQTDRGTEFMGKPFQRMLRKWGIGHFHTYQQEVKAGMVERFNRSLKSRLYRLMTYRGNKRWVDALQKVVQGYNATEHSALGMAPSDVTDENMHHVRSRLYDGVGRYRDRPPAPGGTEKPPRFKVGDHVHTTLEKKEFHTGYTPNFTTEVFVVTRVMHSRKQGFMYKLKDLSNESILGRYTESELTPAASSGTGQEHQRGRGVNSSSVIEIDRVVRVDRARGKVLVRYKGYPESANRWLDASALERY